MHGSRVPSEPSCGCIFYLDGSYPVFPLSGIFASLYGRRGNSNLAPISRHCPPIAARRFSCACRATEFGLSWGLLIPYTRIRYEFDLRIVCLFCLPGERGERSRFLPKWWSPPKKEGISLSHEFGQRLVRMGSKTKVIPLKMRIQFGNNSSDSLLNSRTNHSVEFPPPNGRKKQPKSGFLKGSGPPSGFSPVTPEQKEFPITTISISPFMRDHVIGIPSIANSISPSLRDQRLMFCGRGIS